MAFTAACDSEYEDEPIERAGQAQQEITQPLEGRPVAPLARPPEPTNLYDYVADREAAIALGKALFWDMQVGSDNVQACASCHFNAGADSRSKNQVSPGLLILDPNNKLEAKPDHTFDLGPNRQLLASDFPLRKLADPNDRTSKILKDTNDVVSSQGVYHAIFGENPPHGVDPEGFHVKGTNVRKVEPRNTPSVINAVYNHRNFWDGRAQDIFNGVNPFGDRDPNARLYRRAPKGPGLVSFKMRLDHSSLASQALGPPTNKFEMSADGRQFHHVARSLSTSHRNMGKKLQKVRPLGLQKVHPQDSVLGPMSRWPQAGLKPASYAEMIKKAFRPEYWSAPSMIRVAKDGTTSVVEPKYVKKHDEELYTLAEYNFTMFFGIAIQLYESTLISDNTPFDQYLRGKDDALTTQEKHGMNLFFSAPPTGAACFFCHGGPELTTASISAIEKDGRVQTLPPGAQPPLRVFDRGYFVLGLRDPHEDFGVGGKDPFGSLAAAEDSPLLKTDTPPVLEVESAFKTPGLRNIALTAPYFHTGSYLTLHDVIDFYVRGGDVDPARLVNSKGQKMAPLGTLFHLTKDDKAALVAFLRALTDEGVRHRRAPYDHPQLWVPNGSPGSEKSVVGDKNGQALDEMIEIPAVGKNGGQPLPPFLGIKQ